MDDRERQAIRRRVDRFGLRVVCSACGARDRHRPQHDGRLRDRPCIGCGGRLRVWAWAKAHPAKLAAEGAAFRAVASATARWN